jgi:uncharacterized protein YjeT (DUF2065 family)
MKINRILYALMWAFDVDDMKALRNAVLAFIGLVLFVIGLYVLYYILMP